MMSTEEEIPEHPIHTSYPIYLGWGHDTAPVVVSGNFGIGYNRAGTGLWFVLKREIAITHAF